MKIVRPQPGQGWGELLGTPLFNGGDEIPDEVIEAVDSVIDQALCMGITVDDAPATIFTWHPVGTDEADEYVLHWASDGRAPLNKGLDLLDTIVDNIGGKWLAFCRRPAFVRLLAGRGWEMAGREDEPYLVLMMCQRTAPSAAE